MKTHRLKTVQPYFEDIWNGNKLSEIRVNDRDFQVGDKVELYLYDPVVPDKNFCREIHGEISYVLKNYPVLLDGCCMFCLKNVEKIET